MRTLTFLLLFLFVASCSTDKKVFKLNKVCSSESSKYLRNPRNTSKRFMNNPYLRERMAMTQKGMQQCYENFKMRTGHDEDFHTCLVVGIDEYGSMDFYNFSSQEAKLDKKFLDCANSVTAKVDFASYGWNAILVQSYQFYYE